MVNFSVNLTDDQKDEIVVNVLLKDLFSFEGKMAYPNPEDMEIRDAIKTILSKWYMTPEAFKKVTEGEDTEETKDDKYYWIEPLNGWKWGFPKKISYDNYLGDTMEWFVKNGYPKNEIEKLGKHFSWKLQQRPEETEGQDK